MAAGARVGRVLPGKAVSVKLSDLIQEAQELQARFGDLNVKCKTLCAHRAETPCDLECFKDAYLELRDLGRGTRVRVAVVS